jgi:hypothetical protein
MEETSLTEKTWPDVLSYDEACARLDALLATLARFDVEGGFKFRPIRSSPVQYPPIELRRYA